MAIVNYFQFNVTSTPNPSDPNNTIINISTGPHGLFSGGVVMDVTVSVDATTADLLVKQNISVPSPLTIKALFDTGCTITSIDVALAKKLDLKVRAYAKTATANGVVDVEQHFVSLAFPGTALAGKLVHLVQTVNLDGQPFQMLIGRDLMALWNITYNGSMGFVSISD